MEFSLKLYTIKSEIIMVHFYIVIDGSQVIIFKTRGPEGPEALT